MNENICTNCQTSEPPIDKGNGFLQCVRCDLPQAAGIVYQPDAPKIKLLDCEYCRKTSKPLHQVRAQQKLRFPPVTVIAWECEFCGQTNCTEDDLELLNDEIITGEF